MPLKEAKGKLNMIQRLETLTVVGSLNVLPREKYTGGERKAYLMAMINPGNDWVAGWAVRKNANGQLALRCQELPRRT